MQQNRTLLMSGLVGADDSDDSMDSEEDDSDDPASRQQSPPSNSLAGPSSGGQNKRERPEDMVDTFVAVKRANVPLTSLLTRNERSNPPSGRATPSAPDGPTNGAVEGNDLLSMLCRSDGCFSKRHFHQLCLHLSVFWSCSSVHYKVPPSQSGLLR